MYLRYVGEASLDNGGGSPSYFKKKIDDKSVNKKICI